MATIAVLGLGNFGTALARTWVVGGHDVRGWTVEQEVYDSIRQRGINEKYLENVSLEGIDVSMALADVVPGAEIVALALPSHIVLGVVDDLIDHLSPDQVLLDLAKGLAPGDAMVSEAIAEKLSRAGLTNPLAVITGPTIAPELASGVLTVALVASRDGPLAERLADVLSTPTFTLQAAADPHGAELWGAFKNVIALACGVADGLKSRGSLSGDNLKAAIFTAGFREGVRLLPALGADPETALSAAGIGDLYVTATSPHGRNRRMGQMLGEGKSVAEALEELVMVSEGVRATQMFLPQARSKGIDTPFVTALAELLDGAVGAEECVRRLIS